MTNTRTAAHEIRLAHIEGRNCLACSCGHYSMQLPAGGVSLDRDYADAAQGHIAWVQLMAARNAAASSAMPYGRMHAAVCGNNDSLTMPCEREAGHPGHHS